MAAAAHLTDFRRPAHTDARKGTAQQRTMWQHPVSIIPQLSLAINYQPNSGIDNAIASCQC